MARWTASAKWAEGHALDGRRDMPLALRLNEGLGISVGGMRRGLRLHGIIVHSLSRCGKRSLVPPVCCRCSPLCGPLCALKR